MNYFESVQNFFREDFSDVVGIYHDGFKIFLARYTNKIELEEVNFEIYLDGKSSFAEQLAEKIFMILNQRGWKNSKVGICLNDGDAIIFRTSFENIPQNEIDSAVKVWAQAQVGKNSPYAFQNLDGEIWAETVPENLLNEYISAFEKNSIKLCALTAMPDSTLKKGSDRAVFIAEILKEKKSPNLLAEKIENWNLKKFSLLAVGIFLFLILGLSAKIFYDYKVAENELETVRKNLAEQSEFVVLKKDLDENISEMKKINSMLDAQSEKFSKLNFLIRLGKISGGAVQMKKINATENFVQLEGVAEDPDAIEKYLRKLKNSVAENSKLENTSAADDGRINFSVKINFDE